jgi:hypothetical protein
MRDYHPDDYERRENPVHDAPTTCYQEWMAWERDCWKCGATFKLRAGDPPYVVCRDCQG